MKTCHLPTVAGPVPPESNRREATRGLLPSTGFVAHLGAPKRATLAAGRVGVRVTVDAPRTPDRSGVARLAAPRAPPLDRGRVPTARRRERRRAARERQRVPRRRVGPGGLRSRPRGRLLTPRPPCGPQAAGEARHGWRGSGRTSTPHVRRERRERAVYRAPASHASPGASGERVSSAPRRLHRVAPSASTCPIQATLAL